MSISKRTRPVALVMLCNGGLKEEISHKKLKVATLAMHTLKSPRIKQEAKGCDLISFAISIVRGTIVHLQQDEPEAGLMEKIATIVVNVDALVTRTPQKPEHKNNHSRQTEGEDNEKDLIFLVGWWPREFVYVGPASSRQTKNSLVASFI